LSKATASRIVWLSEICSPAFYMSWAVMLTSSL